MSLPFERSVFHDNPITFALDVRPPGTPYTTELLDQAIKVGEERIQNALDVLNSLTIEQIKIVKMYGDSRFREGQDNAIDEDENY